MSLRKKQSKFAVMVSRLIITATARGYEITLGHALRCRNCHTGRKTSLHKDKLAIDINLFRDGKYLSATEDHRELGELWESWGGTWGGRFNDGNHYGLEHEGRK